MMFWQGIIHDSISDYAFPTQHYTSTKEHMLCDIVAGEDMDKVGGAEADNNFMTLSDTSSCGKMTALAKLLHLWYHEAAANKVC